MSEAVPLAVVGISCRMPGGANSPEELWKVVENGTATWTPVPADRFNEKAFHHPNINDPNGSSTHQGGHFIDADVRDFDHTFFHLSPQQAAATDPQQRMLLETTYEALENAGWSRDAVAGSNTAVYAATFTADFDRNLYKDTLDLPVHYLAGSEESIMANRISHVFDLCGPSVALDTACSGGLIALHQASQSLTLHEIDAAVVVAGNLTLSPDHHLGMGHLHMLSDTGRSYPFDTRGSGYGRGEGFTVLVVKRLDDALRDRDPIHTVIRGIASNHDGYTAKGLNYPNGESQAKLMRTAYARAGLSPETIAYVEAHGTGTVAGDHEELQAIADVFTGPKRSLPLYVGSLKGNIGHLENGSGIASLIKAALILKHQKIPPVAGYENPKPGLPLDRMHISKELVDWPHADGIVPRVSINSTGFGGANAHAIIEQSPSYTLPSEPIDFTEVPRLFMFSANSQASLVAILESYRDWVKQHSDPKDLIDLSYTLCHRRTALRWRFSCVAHDQSSLVEALEKAINSPPAKPVPDIGEVYYVFTGQGAQWAGMGRELLSGAKTGSVFRESIRRSSDILLDLGAAWDLEAELCREVTEENPTLLNTAEVAKPGLTAIQMAIVDLLRSQGVRPHAVVGHSSGEIAGAYAAGRISQRTAIGIAYHGSFQGSVAKSRGLPRGGMLAVGLGEEESKPYLQGLKAGQASIACVNSPKSVTISGDAEAVDEVAERLAAAGQGIFHRRLQVDTAYHSHHMRAVADDYRARLASMGVDSKNEPAEDVIFVSSVTGRVKSSDFDGEYFIANSVSPVRFSDAVETLVRSVIREPKAVFIEIGPHSALAGPFRQILTGIDNGPKLDFGYSAVLQRKTKADLSALSAAGFLFDYGVHVNFDAVSALSPGSEKALVRSDLPSYKWDHTVKHWHESRISRDYRLRPDPYHDLLGVRLSDSTPIEPRWRHMVGLATLPWLADHVVDGLIIFPGSAYLCMAIEAIVQLGRARHPSRSLETISITDVSFLRGLVIPDSTQQRIEVQLSLEPKPNTTLGFRFRITALTDGEWHEHCKGDVEGIITEESHDGELSWSRAPQIAKNNDNIVLTPDEVYKELTEAGNKYGPTFSGIKSFTMADTGLQTSAAIEIPNVLETMPSRHQEPHIIHPTTLDIIFHTGIPMISRNLGKGAAMPVQLDELLLSIDMPRNPGTELSVLATLTSSRFRAAHTDISVASSVGKPVLSVVGMELRSLASLSAADGNAPEICYTMDWQPDVEYLRVEDVSSFHDLVGSICFKRANLKVLQLQSEDCTELTRAFMGAIEANRGSLASFDLVDTELDLFEQVSKGTVGFPKIRHRHLTADVPFEEQSFEASSYDVVLLTSIESLGLAISLLKPGELLVLVLKDSQSGGLDASLKKLDIELDVQLAFSDTASGKRVVAIRGPPSPDELTNSETVSSIQILTHSTPEDVPLWVEALQKELSAQWKHQISINNFNINSVNSNNKEGSGLTIVVDDQPQSPILSDESCFNAATTLLKEEPAHIIWISPDEPASMHQIVGFARTAHAENDKLRLTTAHVAPSILDELSQPGRELDMRLFQFLNNCIGHISTDVFHSEREYRIDQDGIVLVPRLHRSEQLNRAIRDDRKDDFHVESRRFLDNQRAPLVLRDDGITSTGQVAFVEDAQLLPSSLGVAEIEVVIHAAAISHRNSKDDFFEYSGVVMDVGSSVKNFTPGQYVVAISPIMGASRLRVPERYAGLLPSTLSPTVGAGLLTTTMTACYALYELGRIPTTGTILIHGALSATGRAAAAVAFFRGARITVTARDNREARLMVDRLNISLDDVLVARASLYRRRPSDIFANGGIDIILQAGQDHVPAETLAHLKQNGRFIVMGSGSSPVLPNITTLPDRATVHHCTPEDVVRNPGINLVSQAAAALHHFPQKGLELWVRDVSLAADALRLVRNRTTSKVILQAGPESFVQAVVPDPSEKSLIQENASYVIAGGLGDLGQRLMLFLAERGARHFVTLSRRVADPNAVQGLQLRLDVVAPGCHVYCIACDITSDSSVQDTVESLTTMGIPPVHGVIQSAMVLVDRTLDTMTYDEYKGATGVKVDGTLALEKAFTSPHLDFFLLMSSAVSIVGTSGQANYNAGNAVIDALAHVRNKSSSHFLSVNIGLIQDTTSHTANLEAWTRSLSRAGLKPVGPKEFTRFFEHILGVINVKNSPGSRPFHHAMFGFDNESLLGTTSRNATFRSGLFTHVFDSKSASAVVDASDSSNAPQTLAQVIESGESVPHFISNAIADRLARLISADSSSLDQESGSILDLGLDSLVAIELRNWITAQFDAPLQSSEILTRQTIYALAEKVAARSSIIALASSDSSDLDGDTPDSTLGSDTSIHPPLPIPSLSNTLKQFKESRRAVGSETEQEETDDAVQKFEEGLGQKLQHRIEEVGPDAISDAFEQLIYLEWRDPLMEQGQFYFTHTLESPVHSQVERAAILTMAAMEFERLLVAGKIEPHYLHGVPVSSRGHEWLFNTTRRPGTIADRMVRLPSNSTVAVLRRGHVFLLALPNSETEIELPSIYAAYQEIIKASERYSTPVCTLTANDRPTWTKALEELEANPQNSSALRSVESAAFVVCLDDEEPKTAGERHMQFLLNGTSHHMENRWTDKPFQFAVTANGISAGIYDHSKIDGLDGRAMHARITQALFKHSGSELESSRENMAVYPVSEVEWNLSPATLHDIELVQHRCETKYRALDYQTFQANNLDPTKLRSHRVSPNATAYLTAILATYLVDRKVRPSWEVVSQAQLSRGRIEWVQAVSPAVRSFVEAAAARSASRDFFNAAASSYSRAITTAASGHGWVNHMYALRMALEPEEELPEIFKTHAWQATRRGGLEQGIKTGFMPEDDDEEEERLYGWQWDAGSFLVTGEGNAYIHCDVLKNVVSFNVSGHAEYVTAIHDALKQASEIISSILVQG